jgi:hypothetical protein
MAIFPGTPEWESQNRAKWDFRDFGAPKLCEQTSDRNAIQNKVIDLVETFPTVCRTFSAAKYFGSILDF